MSRDFSADQHDGKRCAQCCVLKAWSDFGKRRPSMRPISYCYECAAARDRARRTQPGWPCLCGCGEMANAGKSFRTGHYRRFVKNLRVTEER